MRIKRLNEMNIEEEKTIFFFQRTVSDDLLIFKNGRLWKSSKDKDIDIRKVIIQLSKIENLSEYQICEIKLDGYYDQDTLDEYFDKAYEILTYKELKMFSEKIGVSIKLKNLI